MQAIWNVLILPKVYHPHCRLLKVASEYSPRVTFAMGNLNMTRFYAPDDRYNDTGVLMTVITKEGWEYTVPKETEFSLDNVKQVLSTKYIAYCT